MSNKILKAQFDAPIHWTESFVESVRQVLQLAQTGYRLNALYGTLGVLSLPNGRTPLEHQNIEINQASNIVNEIKKLGLKFFYILNSPFHAEKEDDLIGKLDYLYSYIKCDAFVVSDLRMARIIKSRFKNIDLHISTIANIIKKEDLDPWLEYGPSRIVLHHDLPKKMTELHALLAVLKSNQINPEIMVTESCLFECPWREAHYRALASGDNDRCFHVNCLKRRLDNPAELYMAGSFIRPQDVQLYIEALNIRFYKLSGRSQTERWKIQTLLAYLSGNFNGNLLQLMGMDPLLDPESKFCLPSEYLDNYIQRILTGEDNMEIAVSYHKNNIEKGAR